MLQHRTMQDPMTHTVAHASRDTRFKALAALLTDNDITAVAVVDGRNCPIGMVSEADPFRHAAVLPAPGGHTSTLPPAPRDRDRADTATGLMSAPVITARPQWSVAEAARATDRHEVKRVPVLDEIGQLIGIVSRSDLLRVLRRDTAIGEEITREVLRVGPGAVDVTVADGVVTLRGKVGSKSLALITVRPCRGVDGAVTVHEELRFDDDSEAGSTEKPNPGRVIGNTGRH
ncbi:hypothetical protein GCM10010252_76710 [Streptomyces aureoverticillatus]|nr:hypothetical protein GCM10010252_76710 [Streptomyces aureoverticillatus]